MWWVAVNNRENNEVNAKKIARNMFLGSSDGLPLLGSRS